MIQDRGATGHGDGPKETHVDLNGSDGGEAILMMYNARLFAMMRGLSAPGNGIGGGWVRGGF